MGGLVYKALNLIIFVGMVTGCASVETSISMTRLESPETRGETLRLDGELGVGGTTDVQLVSDASYRPPTFDNPASMAAGSEFFGRVTLDILPWLDIDGRDGLGGNVPATLTAKVQILGKSSKESLKGNFSLAVAGSVGATTENKSGNQDGTFGRGGYPWNTNLNTTMQSMALIVGYRLIDALLLYGGVYRDTYYASGTVHQANSDDGLSPAAQYSMGGDAINIGGNLDLEIALNQTHMALITVELSHGTVTWTSSESLSPTVFGGSLRLRF